MEATSATNINITHNVTKTKVRLKPEKALIISICITLVTMVAEFIASSITESLMLWSDGLHMLSHAASLIVSYVAIRLSKRYASKKFPFGLHRVEIIAALINGVGLALFSMFIVFESIERMFNPTEIMSLEMMLVAGVGLIVNLATAVILSLASLEDLNTKSAFMHMLADTFSSVAILVGGFIIMYTNWFVIDAILSIIIAIVIAVWAWGLLKESFCILLDRTPKSIDYEQIENELRHVFPDVKEIQDIKIRELKSNFYAGHLTIKVEKLGSAAYFGLQEKILSYLNKEHNISRLTIQMNPV